MNVQATAGAAAVVVVTKNGKDDRGLIERIHLKMLETENLEDQINQRPMVTHLISPKRRSTVQAPRLHANQFFFGKQFQTNSASVQFGPHKVKLSIAMSYHDENSPKSLGPFVQGKITEPSINYQSNLPERQAKDQD